MYEGTGDGMHGLPGFGDMDGMLFDLGRGSTRPVIAFTMEGVGYPIDIAWFDVERRPREHGVDGALRRGAVPAIPRGGTAPLGRRGAGRSFAGLGPDDRLVVGD